MVSGLVELDVPVESSLLVLSLALLLVLLLLVVLLVLLLAAAVWPAVWVAARAAAATPTDPAMLATTMPAVTVRMRLNPCSRLVMGPR